MFLRIPKSDKIGILIEKQNKKFLYTECSFLSPIIPSIELRRSFTEFLKRDLNSKIFKFIHLCP
jgi:hypothetical protein